MGGVYWAFLWPALNFFCLARAYALRDHQVVGKGPNGSLAWSRRVFLAPYLVLTWLMWRLLVIFERDAPAHQITSSLWLGRRPRIDELPEGVTAVVDLTAEFAAAAGIVSRYQYFAFPLLDGSVPNVEQFDQWLTQLPKEGALLIHCAHGRGRSFLLMAAWLLHSGQCETLPEALDLVQSKRPTAALNSEQAQFLVRYQQHLAKQRMGSG